jgi:hypothetical protein
MQTSNRYILRYEGPSSMPVNDLQSIQSQVEVLNTSRKMLLIEAAPDTLTDLLQQLPEWTAKPEITHKIPLTQPVIEKRI